MNAANPTRFLRRPEVLKLVGLGNTTVFRLMRAGQFPRSFLLTPRCAVWNEAEIVQWMTERNGKSVALAPCPAGRSQ
jgi:prophage regulatory protein